MATTIQFVNLSPTAPIIDSVGGKSTSPATANDDTPDIVVSGVESGDTLYLYQDGVLVATEEAVGTTHTFTTGTLLEQAYLFKVKRNNGTKTSAFSTTFSYTYSAGPLVYEIDRTNLSHPNDMYWSNNAMSSADGFIEVTINNASTDFWLVIRGSGTNRSTGTNIRVMWAGGDLYFGYYASGEHWIVIEAKSWTNGDVVKLEAIGNTAKLYKNGTQIPNYSIDVTNVPSAGLIAVDDRNSLQNLFDCSENIS